jgi:hypothetical protein
MSFSHTFSDEFLTDDDYLVTLDERLYAALLTGDASAISPPPFGWVDRAVRPKHPPHSPLWRRFLYPLTPLGLYLWSEGDRQLVHRSQPQPAGPVPR